MLWKCILIKIVPKDMLLICTSLTKMVCMDYDTDPGRRSILHNRLTNPLTPVYYDDIPSRQFEFGNHIPHQLHLWADQSIWKLIHDHLIINNFFIGYGSILIKKSSLIQMCLFIKWRIVLWIDSAICIIVFPDQTSIWYNFYSMHPIFFSIHQIHHIVLICSRKCVLDCRPLPETSISSISKFFFQIPKHISHRWYFAVCKKRIKPYNFRIQKSHILCHVLNIILRKHICKYKFSILTHLSQSLRPISLCILYTAAGPSNSQVEIVYHVPPPRVFPPYIPLYTTTVSLTLKFPATFFPPLP